MIIDPDHRRTGEYNDVICQNPQGATRTTAIRPALVARAAQIDFGWRGRPGNGAADGLVRATTDRTSHDEGIWNRFARRSY